MSNSLSAVHPELIVEWSKKNLPLTPDDITFGSNKKVWWKGSCGHEWQTSVKARSNGEKCPICSGARAVAGINDLSTLKPGLASEWSKKNEIKPTEVTVGSHKKVIWKCRLGHEWTASVKSRSINGSGCPYCSHNKVLVGFNDLATVVPEVADEWSEKNEKKPTEVTAFAKSFWENHKTVQFDTLTEKSEYEIVVAFKTVAYTDGPESFKYYHFVNAGNEDEFNAYISKCKELAFYDTGVSATYGDKLITLSTCEYSHKNGRMVVVAKKIAE